MIGKKAKVGPTDLGLNPIPSSLHLLQSFFAGIQWGIGHSAGLIVIAAIFFSLKGSLDLEKVGAATDW